MAESDFSCNTHETAFPYKLLACLNGLTKKLCNIGSWELFLSFRFKIQNLKYEKLTIGCIIYSKIQFLLNLNKLQRMHHLSSLLNS